jgi:hypothetical protein
MIGTGVEIVMIGMYGILLILNLYVCMYICVYTCLCMYMNMYARGSDDRDRSRDRDDRYVHICM